MKLYHRDLLVLSIVGVSMLVMPSVGAAQEITVGPDRLVAAHASGRPLIEPHLAIHPTDANHLLVGAILSSPDISETDCVIYTSGDGAATWTERALGLDACGDPWGVILEDGSAVMTVLGTRAGDDSERVELLVYRSPDGGRTWPDGPVSLGSGHDHQTLAVDMTSGPRHGTLYVAAAQSVRRPPPERFATRALVAASTDGGRSFPDTTAVYPVGMSFNTMTPAVLSDGTLIVPFSDYSRRVPDGTASLDVERDWVLISRDGGQSFSAPYMVSDVCERSWSALAVDRSDGPVRDRLYYVCNDGDFRGVWAHWSSDGGISWSDPIQLNRESGRNPYARTPSIATSGNGVTLVTFHDGRNQPSFRGLFRCQRVFATASVDGGETWAVEVPVSTEPSCPISTGNGDVGMRFPQGGDYHGLAALPDGSFRVVWSDARSGVFALRTAVVQVR